MSDWCIFHNTRTYQKYFCRVCFLQHDPDIDQHRTNAMSALCCALCISMWKYTLTLKLFRILKIKIRKITSEDKFFAESSLETYGKNQN